MKTIKPPITSWITVHTKSSQHVHLHVRWPRGVKGDAGAQWKLAQDPHLLTRLAREQAPPGRKTFLMEVSIFDKRGIMCAHHEEVLDLADWQVQRDIARRHQVQHLVRTFPSEQHLLMDLVIAATFQAAGVPASAELERRALELTLEAVKKLI